MSKRKNKAAMELGRKGGQSTSDAKRAASAINAAKATAARMAQRLENKSRLPIDNLTA